MVANVLDRFEFRSVRANEAEEICLKGWNMHRNFFLLQ